MVDKIILEQVKSYLEQGFSRRQITKSLLKGKISPTSIAKYLGDFEIEIRKRKKIELFQKIIVSYKKNNGKFEFVREELRTSDKSIINALKYFNINKIEVLRNNQHARKLPINQDFFAKIDSEIKAYYLGFFYADGNVSFRKDKIKPNTTVSKAEIALAESDVSILEPLSYAIYNKNTVKIYKYKNRSGVQNKASFVVNSKKLCEDLQKLGCVPKKSLILNFPTEEQVPSNLVHHFIRGYFDGDGHIGVKNGSCRYNFGNASSIFFNTGLKVLLEKYKIQSTITSNLNNYAPEFSILRVIGGQKAIEDFYNFIYKDAIFFLRRKYEIFLKIINYKKPIKLLLHYNGKNIRLNRNNWEANIPYKGKKIYVGFFKNKEDAILKYNQKVDEINKNMS